ncbi:hypothetical protein IWW36_004692 [Coemansia brasiliensis]|uniref:Uncharacterized protein n=1 Tax=Coemansia brasiliensis TaxID=2650707 RepID=A0A9W8IA97_9FUNG|nr:hypothetical protein IWW36_004692 [Coemansia brasiliensis]
MSQNLNEPWLCGLFAKQVELDKNNCSDGRRLQLTRFQEANERIPVTCEVSDRYNYMRAGLTRKSTKAFKRSMKKDIKSMEGVVIQVKTFQLKLYNHDKSERRKGKQPDCPERISKVNKSQFWMLITSFSYLGGEGNAIFDQPRYIDNDPRVAEKLLLLAAKKPKSERVIQNHASHDQAPDKSTQADGSSPAAAVEGGKGGFRHARKRRHCESGVASARESDAHGVVGRLPAMDAAEDVWTCVSLWQTVSIQATCVPAMPIYGMHGERRPFAAGASAQTHNAGSNACAQFGRVQAPSMGVPCGQPQMPPAAAAARSTLGGLLISKRSQLVPASDVMEKMYGSMSSPLTEPLYDMGHGTDSERIDAGQLLEKL